ncbi:hypothetical protein [Actinosynnema sp. NPDC023587]|uniref:hypothetical protein n=1 Tax=Actinosynnema sp. NPDC023587 TaxID=3154695 RepID=UPI0033D2B852
MPGRAYERNATPAAARELVALVDGFATLGPRHWRARAARGRRETWLGGLATQVRDGALSVPAGSALEVVSAHRGRSTAKSCHPGCR